MDDKINENFIRNLEYFMKEKNVKASEMEAFADISAGYISRLKNTMSFPSVEVLISFANSLKVTIDSLIYGNYSMSSKDEQYIASFLTKLLNDTNKESVYWTKLSSKNYLPDDDSKKLKTIYEEKIDSDGEWAGDFYTSLFFDENKCEVRDSIFKLKRQLQDFYLIPIKKYNEESNNRFLSPKIVNGFEMYVFRNNKLNKIIASIEGDNSAIYNLMLSIYISADGISKKTKLDDEAKKALEGYINGSDNDIIF